VALDGVARTAYDAARGKLAATSRGYFGDEFARCFCAEGPSPAPLINRGHYVRVAAIGSLCEQFLHAARGHAPQIVSLGAGFDTRYWQLHAAGEAPAMYIEIDQPPVVCRKCELIAAEPALLAALPEGAAAVGTDMSHVGSSCYQLRSADVRDVAALEAALGAAGWDPGKPTLVLLECLLVYLPPDAATAVLQLFASKANRVVLAGYEQIKPDDAFGRTMMDNLRRRDCPLLGLPACPDNAAQVARCEAAGYARAEAIDLLEYYERVLSADERGRVASLELLDEVEEWSMLMQHYCAVLAVRDVEGGGGLPDGGEGGAGEGAAQLLFAQLLLRAPVGRPYPPSRMPLGRGRVAHGSEKPLSQAR